MSNSHRSLVERVVTIAFTGNREQKFRSQAQQEKAKQILAQMITRAADRAVELGFFKISYISGVAPGVDTWASQLVIQQAKQRRDIKVELVAAVPTVIGREDKSPLADTLGDESRTAG